MGFMPGLDVVLIQGQAQILRSLCFAAHRRGYPLDTAIQVGLTGTEVGGPLNEDFHLLGRKTEALGHVDGRGHCRFQFRLGVYPQLSGHPADSRRPRVGIAYIGEFAICRPQRCLQGEGRRIGRP
ncbi:MAG: hypothetical protein FP810_18455 [Desulfocapsa sp.]|nr:hypothetical protein [Desulfocapsa sp.]MBU4108135.1 hypothetical protein [Pseudomonadota bacterium]